MTKSVEYSSHQRKSWLTQTKDLVFKQKLRQEAFTYKETTWRHIRVRYEAEVLIEENKSSKVIDLY